MGLPEVEALLNAKIGLDPASIGSETIARCVRRRMSELGLSDERAYGSMVAGSELELEELAEEVIVPETWFFRDREPFRLLGSHATSEWLPGNPGGVFRVLSVPCCTGEEPYSVAMTLLDAGLTPGGFQVDAVDLSKRALSTARQAAYGRNSFRGEDLTFRDRHFERVETRWRLNPPVTGSVRFIQGNLLNSPFFLTADPYDAILCRNLLIYFDRPAREKTVRVLDRLLKPSGLLFVGHAEPTLFWGERFAPIRQPGAFACRKREERPVTGQRKSHESRVQGPGAKSSPGSRVQGQRSRSVTPDSGPGTPDSGPGEGREAAETSLEGRLEVAERLADEGRLSEAAAMCESALRDAPAQPRAFFLMGLIRQAAGDHDEAERYYHRTIYLDPDHADALVHLALLADLKGDRSGAARFRQRHQRAGGRETGDMIPKTDRGLP